MLPNLIILFAGLFILYGVAMLWLRQSLMSSLGSLRQNELILDKDLEKRRDLVPFLLEGAREGAQITDSWQMLLQKRAKFTEPKSFAEELEFEKILQDYLLQNACKSLMYLEAKRDIQGVSKRVEAQKETLNALTQSFNEKRKKFPYSLASAIFGVHEVAPL